MRCAIETAHALGLAAEAEPALSELDYGKWRGMRLSELAASHPASLQRWLNDPASAPHGGESFEALQSRVGGWIDSLPEQGSVIAITHVPVIRAALVHAIGLDRKAAFDLRIAPMDQVTLIKARGGLWLWDRQP
jgi:broad specificity phosphatase PhoE